MSVRQFIDNQTTPMRWLCVTY